MKKFIKYFSLIVLLFIETVKKTQRSSVAVRFTPFVLTLVLITSSIEKDVKEKNGV